MKTLLKTLQEQISNRIKVEIVALLIVILVYLCVQIAPPNDNLKEELGDDFEEWNNNRFANRHPKLMITGICVITLILLVCLLSFCAKDLIKLLLYKQNYL